MSHHIPITVLFRMVLLTWLTLGLCLQPTIAATCAIDDARSALAADGGAAVIAADGDDSGTAGDCCSNSVCSDCCLHAAGSLHSVSVEVVSVMPIRQASPPADEFRPRDYPVDTRPPITG